MFARNKVPKRIVVPHTLNVEQKICANETEIAKAKTILKLKIKIFFAITKLFKVKLCLNKESNL